MKKLLVVLVLLAVGVNVAFADEILAKLRQMPKVSDVKKLEVSNFNEYYQFWYEQPIDHNDPSKGTFKQKVQLGHKKAQTPVVAALEGYALESASATELTLLLKANQVVIEHRFFDQSVPKDGIPWDYLTIKQAAADQHEIIQAVKKNIYPESKWVSTGVSKGGQATIFHRYFYPDDVNVSVPYVAPLNLEYVDPRFEKFLDKLGTKKVTLEEIFGGGGDSDCRYAIRDFQFLCFKNIDNLIPMMTGLAEEKGYTFEIAGGVKRAVQLMILEYPFAFWQWGNSCENIPPIMEVGIDEIYENLVKVSPPEFFEDKSIIRMQPFFYSSLTETGMYDYNIRPFKKYLNDKENITFAFAMPEGVKQKPFNEKQMKEINEWLQTDAEKILFIYGGTDPWTATAVDLKMNSKCRKYVKGDMCHTCTIASFDPVSKEDLIDTIKEWLK